MNGHWGYCAADQNWKSTQDLLQKLADIVSKGGNYLLNVGPTAAGVIPERCQEILRSVGRWLKVNGGAIYGAGPTPFGEELGDFAATLRDAAGKPVFLARADWRCTTQQGKLNFIVFKWPRNGFELPRFKNAIKRAYFLADADRHPLELKTGDARIVTVTTPRNPANPVANVIVVEIEGDRVAR
jgi:alpha-L-fucosidase